MSNLNAPKANSNSEFVTPSNLIKKPSKIEKFAELLITSGKDGVSRWSGIGKLRVTNIGAYPHKFRRFGINITKGATYILMDMESAISIIDFINKHRLERNADRLTDDVVTHWLKPFIEP